MNQKKFPLNSLDIAEEKRRQLKQLFPEAFTEARDSQTGELKHAVDWDKLKASLGEVLEKEGERFGLTWPGKSGLLKIIQQPSVGTLKPCREESVNFDETENLFIEGDNLEVLKLLQKSYFGKVKMIYIDPPYNTGNEFVYPDNFTESLETYLQYTGMVDAQGRKFSTNAATEGRFHSKWLNMMYPRLFLARNLLREDGVIFASIDDNESSNLKKVCDEIFGEENFMCSFVWEKRYAPPPDTKDVGYQHETLLFYRRSEAFSSNLLPFTDEQTSRYSNPDDDPRGPWKAADYTCRYTADERPTLYYPILNPNTGLEVWPKKTRVWSSSAEITQKNITEDRLWWGVDGTNSTPALKNFLSEIQQGRIPGSILYNKEAGHTDEAAKELRKLLPEIKFTPKPTRLLKHLMSISTGCDHIVLDFFSGSCSTAHAVLDLNNKDGGNRKFVMVQLPEPCDEKTEAFKAGYKTIVDIGKERIRRVVQKISEEQDGQLDFQADSGNKQDLGFRVFKLSESNFQTWEGDASDPEKLKEQLEMHINHIDPKATPEDILYELLLKAGFPLTTQVEAIDVAGKSACSIAEGALIICLDDSLTKDAIQAIAALKPVQCICLDAAFHENDQLKTNAVQTMDAAEVQFRTV
ncbi:MAG: site-specific DNA-methyltransferase [Opitutales bacterium]|nr:site-specific DNA-methyltransferase [Opitutales bacterium]